MEAPKYKIAIAIKKGGFYTMYFVKYIRAKEFVLEMQPRLDWATVTEIGKGAKRRLVAGYSKANHEYTEFESSWFKVED